MKAAKWAVVVLSGLTVCAMAQEKGPKEGREGGERRKMGPPMEQEGLFMRALAPDSKWAKEIGMTEEQSAALKKLFSASQTETEATREKMQKLGMEQAELLSKDAPDEAAVLKVVDQLGALRNEMARHRIRQMLAAQKILTPEQRAKLREQMKVRRDQFRDNRKEEHGMKGGNAEGRGPADKAAPSAPASSEAPAAPAPAP
jgi:Spy/CpxP family protein refolding chaperone